MPKNYEYFVAGCAFDIAPTLVHIALLSYSETEAKPIPECMPFRGEWGENESVSFMEDSMHPLPCGIKIIYLPSEKSPNKAEVFNLDILPESKVEEVVRAYYRQERPSQIVELKTLSKDAIKQLALAFSTIERIQTEIDTIKQRVKEEMESRGIYNFQCPEFNISIRKEHIQKRFDGKKFKEDFPEIYEKYVKDIEIKSSINIDYKGS